MIHRSIPSWGMFVGELAQHDRSALSDPRGNPKKFFASLRTFMRPPEKALPNRAKLARSRPKLSLNSDLFLPIFLPHVGSFSLLRCAVHEGRNTE
jgi:hypothetical protein